MAEEQKEEVVQEEVLEETAAETSEATTEAATEEAAEKAAEAEATPAAEAQESSEPAAAPEEAPAADAAMEELKAAIGQLQEQMSAMGERFEQRIQHTDNEEKIIDRMHDELQKYRDGLYFQLVRPILQDIIDIRDSILRVSAKYESEGKDVIELKTFRDYSYDLQDILEKNDIVVYRGDKGGKYEAVRQKVVSKVETADSAAHGTVAETLSDGYEYQGKVICPEKIRMYTYVAPKEPVENTEEKQDASATAEENTSEAKGE